MAIGMNYPGESEAHHHWGWLLVLGIAMMILGLIALSMTFAATLAAVWALGVVLLVGGVFEFMNAFQKGRHGDLWMHLFSGILDIVCGALLIAFPGTGAAGLTFILAIFFLVGGPVRVFSALMLRLPNKGWAIFSGIIDFLLGVVLLVSWPFSAFWFLGTLVGIALIFRGIWWSSFAFSVHQGEDTLPGTHGTARA
jgi:uncharacterized membrane protein HdeD (DUF308 family)